jgi:hypothetical protein
VTLENSSFTTCHGVWTCAHDICNAYLLNETSYAAIRIRDQFTGEVCEETFHAFVELWRGTLSVLAKENKLLFRVVLVLTPVSLFVQLLSVLVANSLVCSIVFFMVGKLGVLAAAIVNVVLAFRYEEKDPPPGFLSITSYAAQGTFMIALLVEGAFTTWELFHAVQYSMCGLFSTNISDSCI